MKILFYCRKKSDKDPYLNRLKNNTFVLDKKNSVNDVNQTILCEADLISIIMENEKLFNISFDNLKIYDFPSLLEDFTFNIGTKEKNFFVTMNKPCKKMQKVYDEKMNEYIMINVKPNILLEILNGKKNIYEKFVLKDLIND